MRNFRNWEIWSRSRAIVKEAYLLTNKLPDSEKYGLTSQIRRAAVSLPANIAEGAGRKSEKELRHFLHNAIGSGFELETLIILCEDLHYLTPNETKNITSELQILLKMINSFISKLS